MDDLYSRGLYDLKVKLPYDPAMRTIGFYVSPGFQMLDLAGPAGAFEAASRELGRPAYRITVLAAEAGAVILPAMPGWYHGVKSVQDLVDFLVARILDQLAISHDLMRRWGDP